MLADSLTSRLTNPFAHEDAPTAFIAPFTVPHNLHLRPKGTRLVRWNTVARASILSLHNVTLKLGGVC